MSIDNVDWMLIEVTGYDVSRGIIHARSIADGTAIAITKNPDQNRDWVSWLANPSRPESAPPGSILALYNVKAGSDTSGATHTAGWGTTISKNITTENVVVAPLTVSHTIKSFPNGGGHYVDGILLDNRSIAVENPDSLRQAICQAIDETPTPLQGQRGFMVRAVSAADPEQGYIEAFYGRSNVTGSELFDFHWNRPATTGYQENRLRANASTIRYNNFDKTNLVYEVVGFSRAIVQTYGSERQMRSLTEMPHYRMSAIGTERPRQAFSMAAVVVDPERPNQIKHHLPLPRAKVKNSLFGVLPVSEIQQRLVGVITHKGVESQYAPRKVTLHLSAPEYPLSIEDYVNNSGKVRSFRVYAPASGIDRYAKRIESAVQGVKPFRVDSGKAYSFPIEFKNQIQSSLSDLTGAPPLYVREVTIDGSERLIIDGRTNDADSQTFLARLKKSIPHAADQVGRPTFDLASFNQIATHLKQLPPASAAPSLEAAGLTGSNNASLPVEHISPPRSQHQESKVTFADWLEQKFLGRYDAMIDYLYSDISTFAEEQASIDWSHSSSSYDVGTGTSRGNLIKGSKRVRPVDGSRDHAGSIAYAINTFEKSDPKFKNPLRWFNINFINKKIKREGAFVFNGYEHLKEAYERDNGLEVSSNTQQRLQELEQERQKRAAEAERKYLAQLKAEQTSRDQWMKRYPGLQDEDGTSKIFEKKKLEIIIGHIPLKQGIDPKLGRYTAIRLHDIENNFRGVQQLFESPWFDKKGRPENKLFVHGSQFKDDESDTSFATHAVIGQIEPGKPIYIVEGLSTGASVFEATGCATVVSLNANNLPDVVGAYRRTYPEAQLVIVADNDKWKPLKGNTGVLAAARASIEHNAHYVIPEFSNSHGEHEPTDANDLRILLGLDALQSQLLRPLAPIPDRVSYENEVIKNCGLEALGSRVEELTAESNPLNKDATLRRLVHAAVIAYGKDAVLNYLAPEFKDFVAFDLAAEQPKEVLPHVRKPDIEVLEAVSPSKKKYCFIRDNSGGKHSDAINAALKSVVGKNALSYNESLKGWVAPYPTMNIMRAYLHEQTNSARLYIGKARGSGPNDRFVVRGNLEDASFQETILNKIEFAEPRYLKSEFGVVVDKPQFLEHVKRRLSEYLVSPKLQLHEPEPQKDSQQIYIEDLIARARSISGQDNASIVRAVHRLTSGMYPAIFKDDDYLFAGLYARSMESLDATPSPDRHLKAIDAAAGLYITLDRQGVLDTALTTDMRAQTKGLCMQVKSLGKGQVLIGEKEISRIATEHDCTDGDVISRLKGNIGKPSVPEGATAELLNDLRRQLSTLSYSILSKKPSSLGLKQDTIPQADRVTTLLELTEMAASEGYSLEEYQDVFLKSAGSPYHPKGGSFDPALLQADIVFIEKNKVLNGNHTPLTTEAGLFDLYVEKAADNRLNRYREYIKAMVAERGHLTYESFSAYLKGKREPVTDVPNPYFMEGEFNEELLEHDVARLTMYKNHQALYQDVGANQNPDNTDLFAEQRDQQSDITAPTVAECTVERSTLIIDEQEIPLVHVTAAGSELYRVRHSLPNHAGEAIAIDAWFKSESEVTPFILNSRAPEHDDEIVASVEMDVVQHVTRQGATFALSKTLSEPEIFFFSGGHAAVENNLNFATPDRLEAQRQYAAVKRNILKSEEQSISRTVPNPTLPDFIREAVNAKLSPNDFTEALAASFGVGLNEALKKSIVTQYGMLLERSGGQSGDPTDRFERLQEVVAQYIRDGLDYDDIYEDLLSVDGSLVEKNPYFGSGKIDKKAVVTDLKEAGFSSVKSLYENLYQLVHGSPLNQDMLPRSNTLLPSNIVSSAPLHAQFESLQDVVRQHGMSSLAFDQNNFPTMDEWKRMPNSLLPIHPVLAVDLDAGNAAETLRDYDSSALTLLADIHAVDTGSVDPKELASKVIDQWSVRSRVSRLSIDEMQDLTKEEREDIALALGMGSFRAKNVSAKAISDHLNRIETVGRQRSQEYSYIVGALAYENRFDRLPAYASRDIARRIDGLTEAHSVGEQQRAERQMNRHQAATAIAVISAIPSMERQQFSADSLRQLEVISSGGKDYIGSYRHFYKAAKDRIALPREVSHHGVYNGGVYGLPYALSTEECKSSGLAPLSKGAVQKVLSSVDGWLSQFGAFGLESNETGSLYVVSKLADTHLLVMHDGDRFTQTHSAQLSEILARIPTDLLHFSDRNAVSEEVGKRLATQMQCSYIDVECRLANEDCPTAETVARLRGHAMFGQWLSQLGESNDHEAVHYVGRRVIEQTAEGLLNSSDNTAGSLLSDFLECLPDPGPLPVQKVRSLTPDSLRLFLDGGYEIAGVPTGSEAYKALATELFDAPDQQPTDQEVMPTEFTSLSTSEAPIDETTNVTLSNTSKPWSLDEQDQPNSGDHLFITDKNEIRFCARVVTCNAGNIRVTSQAIEAAIATLAKMDNRQLSVMINDNLKIRVDGQYLGADYKWSPGDVIDCLSSFHLRSLAGKLGVDTRQDRSGIRNAVAERVIPGSPDHEEVLRQIGLMEQEHRRNLLEKVGLAPVGGVLDLASGTLEITPTDIQCIKLLPAKAYNFAAYTSLAHFTSDIGSTNQELMASAYATAFFSNVDADKLVRISANMPSEYDYICLANGDRHSWALSGPSGIHTRLYDDLPSVLDATVNERTALQSKFQHEADPDLVCVLHRGGLVEGEKLDFPGACIEGKTLVRIAVDGATQVQMVDDDDILPAAKADLEGSYTAELQRFRGSCGQLAEQLSQELGELSPSATLLDQVTAAYCANRAEGEAKMVQSILESAGPEVTILRNGTAYALTERSSSGEEVSTPFSSLSAIEAHLVAQRRADRRKAFAKELTPPENTANMDRESATSPARKKASPAQG